MCSVSSSRVVLRRAERVAAAVNPLIAGHMRKKPYGDHIDNHDVVVRFNLVPLERKHVGMRTHVRLLNFANSKKVCDKGQKELMAGEKSLGDLRSVMLWHKLSRGAVTDCIKRTALAGGEVAQQRSASSGTRCKR